MIEVLITVFVFCIVGGLLWYLVTMLPLPAPVQTVVRVCFVLILCLLLLGALFGGVQLPSLSLRR